VKGSLYEILVFSGLLRGITWFYTDVSRLPIGPIIKGKVLGKLVP
jgi:hypothetical protein